MIATLEDSEPDWTRIMAVAHRDYPVYGVQFHPESVLTADGYRLLANYLQLAGLTARQPPSQNPPAVNGQQPAARSPADQWGPPRPHQYQ